MDFSSSQKTPAATTSTKPRRGSSNTENISSNTSNGIQTSNTSSSPQLPVDDLEYGADLLTSFDGRSTESLSFEILGLRDIVGGMREFILQSLLNKAQVKDKPKDVFAITVADDGTDQSDAVPLPPLPRPPPSSSSLTASSSTAEIIDFNTMHIKESCERLNIDWLDLGKLYTFDSSPFMLMLPFFAERLRRQLTEMFNELQLCKAYLNSKEDAIAQKYAH